MAYFYNIIKGGLFMTYDLVLVLGAVIGYAVCAILSANKI
jgi:hypothetical protein